jgi:hypothetical protein
MAETITRAWKNTARVGMVEPLRKLAAGSVSEKKIQAFVKALGAKLKRPLTKRQIKILEGRIRSIYKVAKKMGAREAKSTFNFAQVDARAVQVINRHQVFWVGDFYSEHLSKRIAGVAEDVMIQQGLPQREAARVLKQALHQEFGITPGGRSQFAKDIPARYAGNPDLYFRQVASNAAHQSRTFGKMRAFSDAGVVSYRLINPMDTRTGQICQVMAGRVFTVETGVKHMERMLGATDPKEIKDIAPWLSAPKLQAAANRGDLEKVGAILPPFHALCRTEPVVIS